MSVSGRPEKKKKVDLQVNCRVSVITGIEKESFSEEEV